MKKAKPRTNAAEKINELINTAVLAKLEKTVTAPDYHPPTPWQMDFEAGRPLR